MIRCGHTESETSVQAGTLSQLPHLLTSVLPSQGSSGGPIIDSNSGAVVGMISGRRMDNRVEGERGWGAAAEGIFEVCCSTLALARILKSHPRTDVFAARVRPCFQAQIADSTPSNARRRNVFGVLHGQRLTCPSVCYNLIQVGVSAIQELTARLRRGEKIVCPTTAHPSRPNHHRTRPPALAPAQQPCHSSAPPSP